MRRLAAAFCAVLLLASQADARTLVVFRKTANIDGPGPYTAQRSGQRFDEVLRDLLDHVTGGQSDTAYGYVGVRDDQINTEDLRNGQIVYGRGTPNPRVVQFDAVLTVGMPLTNTGAGRVRLDSVFIANKNLVTAGGPRVPLGILLSDEFLQSGAGTTVSCAKCSLGVADASEFLSGVQIGYLMQKVGSTRGWYTAGLFNSLFLHSSSREPAGGYRPLLLANASAYDRFGSTGVVPSWRDSADSYATDDSVVAWELPHGGFAASLGASPAVFAYPDGNGGAKDSLMLWAANNSIDPILSEAHLASEVDPAIMLLVLARLDSLSGHRVFSPNKIPLRLGVTIDGGFMRTTHLPGPGIAPTDSTFFKATLDSLAKLEAAGGVKFYPTVGVNVDSMAVTYASELGWWRKWPTARFSPQVWCGVKTTKTTAVGDGITHPNPALGGLVDMLGFRRARFFKGDAGSFTTGTDDQDTSICSMMMGLRSRMLTGGVRPEEMSHTLLPPLDDWSPASIAGTGRVASGLDRDSMLYVCRTCGGFSVIRSSNVASQSQPWRSGSSAGTFRGVSNGTWGYAGREGYYNDAAGVPVKVLVGGWRSPLGAYRAVAFYDSTLSGGGDTGSYDPLFEGHWATWQGLTRTREYEQGDYRTSYPSDRGLYTVTDYYSTVNDNWLFCYVHDSWPGSAHILTLSMADLSGRAGRTEANGSRNGYWLLKSLKNSFDTINDFAGRTVCRFDYPENIPVNNQ